LTGAAVRAALQEGGLEPFRGMVESLAGEFDVRDVALAAFKLLHQPEGSKEEVDEIPVPVPHREREWSPRDQNKRRGSASRYGPGPGLARLFIGLGRETGVNPKDLVGAIANEAGVPGRDIGVVEIADRFSLVEVPEEVADYVIDSLRGGRIKGRKVTIRRER